MEVREMCKITLNGVEQEGLFKRASMPAAVSSNAQGLKPLLLEYVEGLLQEAFELGREKGREEGE